MRNWHRWLITLGLGFLGGVVMCAADDAASFGSYVRHGLLGMGPAVAALKMNLEQK